METLRDLIEEAKLRSVWWAVCIFLVTYILTHTSKSMWLNVPIAILLVSGAHILLNEVDFHWKIRKKGHSYLSPLERKQLSVNDSRLSTFPPRPKWKRKVDSPIVKAAMEEFVNKILQEFVADLWYSNITPDKEAPVLIHAILMDVLAEISTRFKEINIVNLLTRDVVDLVGDHLELFRKNQAAIGREVMVTLSSEERDERLKHHLMDCKELHPALISPESEYKYLKRIMGAVLAAVLRPREAQCPLVRCIARELLTCLVMEPVMRFASPGHINELIEVIFLATTNMGGKETGGDQSSNATCHTQNRSMATNHVKRPETASVQSNSSCSQKSDKTSAKSPNSRPSRWARVHEAITQRRTEVLQPENLENMWTKGRNYMKKAHKNAALGLKSGINEKDPGKETSIQKLETSSQISLNHHKDDQQRDQNLDAGLLCDHSKMPPACSELVDENSNVDIGSKESASPIQVGGHIISEFYSANIASDKVIHNEGFVPKLRCRVLGAFFENLDSKSFAVYSISVTDADNKTWFVKRRYRNFERLHRHLKDIPNYTLHLPPKRIFSSSTEDAFVLQRCIQLDKYLQDLLSIANIAEQHEVWDFLSMSSKSYSFGRSSSVVRTLAVNVDNAMDDIVRQSKGVLDGPMQKVVNPCSPYESSASAANRNVSWKADEPTDSVSKQTTLDEANKFSDNEEHDKNKTFYEEMNTKNDEQQSRSLDLDKKNGSEMRPEILSLAASFPLTLSLKEDPLGVPAEWTPPNVSLPLLNLVDKIFQLNRRGWLRRQVFWISKQIVQLMMEDAIDDWLLRQIHWLRREDIVAQGIRWIQDVLWPGGTFFLKIRTSQMDSSESNKANKQGSFEEQLEAARRASDIKKMIFKGAPSTLVSLIGSKQYKRSAKDVYYFLQSAVCLKQLGYGLLELALVTVFPELRDIISNVHEKKNTEGV